MGAGARPKEKTMFYFADAGYPDGLGGENDISLRELSNKLARRTIADVLFEDGYLVMTLDNGTSFKVRGNSREDDSVAIVVDVPERRRAD
ncbi:hypothetical protein WL40_14375 [Burkholderia ubonensis]|nr:hypothetical protein WJ41_35100 [Burkholderia ubonensis]KVT77343.1 hypothetical protein WK58_11250 [Burkholderia ubonensis]KVT98629.1 hypothetical protein WK61_09370 [Burkholderia ubonensis]KWB68202.1 hypothetical protein WL40_14375 [Burkholderia ubonensis]